MWLGSGSPMMHADAPCTLFYYHLVAVLQCHFVPFGAATISPSSVKCSMIHVLQMERFVSWKVEKRLTPVGAMTVSGITPSSPLSIEEVLHGPSYFLVFNPCCSCVWTCCPDYRHHPYPPLIPSDFVLIMIGAEFMVCRWHL